MFNKFAGYHLQGKIGLMGHVVCGYPSARDSLELARLIANAGCDVLELQFPFSEPMADGPVIMAANHKALAKGMTVAGCFELVTALRQNCSIPLLAMTYLNIPFRYGFENFVRDAKNSGLTGAIIPDLPLDLADDFLAACTKHDFAAIPVVSPNMPEQRIIQSLALGSGLVYAVARSGVTGAKTAFGNEIALQMSRIRAHSSLPIAVGFGVSSREDVDFLRGKADLAVVGSQALRSYDAGGLPEVEAFWLGLRNQSQDLTS